MTMADEECVTCGGQGWHYPSDPEDPAEVVCGCEAGEALHRENVERLGEGYEDAQ